VDDCLGKAGSPGGWMGSCGGAAGGAAVRLGAFSSSMEVSGRTGLVVVRSPYSLAMYLALAGRVRGFPNTPFSNCGERQDLEIREDCVTDSEEGGRLPALLPSVQGCH